MAAQVYETVTLVAPMFLLQNGLFCTRQLRSVVRSRGARLGVQEHCLLTGNSLPGKLVPAAAQIIRVWSITAAQVPVC